MNKILFALAALFILFIIFIFALYEKNNLFGTKTSAVTIDGHTFTVEVARTQKEREVGLSGRNSLARDHGMLFLFDKPTVTVGFWMKNMHFPLDIIYINGTKVVTVFQDLPPGKGDNPPTYYPGSAADKVLEIPAGSAKKYTITSGDDVKISL